MRIPQNITNEVIEKLYETSGDNIINLSASFKTLRLGMLPRLCQFIITYLKIQPETHVKFFQLDSDNEELIIGMLQDPQGLTATLMAEHVFAKDLKVNDIVKS